MDGVCKRGKAAQSLNYRLRITNLLVVEMGVQMQSV
jgi:hypothetical protein